MAAILLIEDDPNQRVLYEATLRAEGYEVASVGDGREALAHCERALPDLVVMDISMPGMDGMDLMGRLLGRNHSLPIILNTAYAWYKEDFRTWAADAYIIKSSDLSELKNAVRRVLSRRECAGTGAKAHPT